jgi:tetratricopeptide (TPR) repeat protein
VILAWAGVAVPVSAQTGMIKGKVIDAQNKPVEGATVTLQQVDTNSKFQLKTKKNGEYMQIGVPPGPYKVTVEKDGLSSTQQTRISLGLTELDFTLTKGGSGEGMSKEDAAKAEAKNVAIRAAFKEGATLSNAGKHDEAIAKFNEVLQDVPKCPECYIGIGASSAAKKDYAAAETAYKKAIELDPNAVDAYNGLATIYNDQKKFTEAQAMSAEGMKRATAGGGSGSADAMYNAGVISWNANDFPKAQEQFAAAVAANPNHAESHFMLGRVYLNLGKLPDAAKEFETYTKIAPNGPNAKEAASNFEMLKTYIK